MSLLAEATRIAREFDYPAEQVQRGVAEYIRQQNEGLAKENTTLSQIPTFVTAVPNGTEKVRPVLLSPRNDEALTNLYPGSLPGR
jgi:hexokinase